MIFDITLDYDGIQKKTSLVIPEIKKEKELVNLLGLIWEGFSEATMELISPNLFKKMQQKKEKHQK